MAAPYYDRTMSMPQAKLELSRLSAVKDAKRSKDGVYVYKIAGGGEAMAESAGPGSVRLRIYKGRCPC